MIYKRGGYWHIDVTVHGVRYREGLDTTDRREALTLETKRVAEILAGKAASKSGRESLASHLARQLSCSSNHASLTLRSEPSSLKRNA